VNFIQFCVIIFTRGSKKIFKKLKITQYIDFTCDGIKYLFVISTVLSKIGDIFYVM